MNNAARIPQKLASTATEQLAKFGRDTPGIGLAVLSTTDGFEVATYKAERAVSAKMAAMGSSLQALSEAITREAGLKAARKLIIESDNGAVLALGINECKPAMSLVVVADKSASLGHLLWSAKLCCASVVRAVNGS
jgi:predicted regulator of Ras-like GTPase activity (Roadblock/LC7/MglB family)